MFLSPTYYIDCDSSEVVAFAEQACRRQTTSVGKAIELYYAVRDQIRYDPYDIDLAPTALKASSVLKKGTGFCISKATLLAATARCVGIPSRLGYADVRNHLTTKRLREQMKTDVFVFHGYTALYLDQRWVKATPAFNLSLCERFGVAPLEFDGRSDSLFHQFDVHGNRHMEYIRDRGLFADLPREEILQALCLYYPELVSQHSNNVPGCFAEEATREREHKA